MIWGLFNLVNQVIVWGLSNHAPSFGEHVLMLWLLVLVFVGSSFCHLWWRVCGHPSLGGKGPSSCGLEYSTSRRKMPVLPSPWDGGVPTHYTPSLFGFANHCPGLWVVISILGSTICWCQWALTSLPPPHIHVHSDLHSHITLPKVFTHLQWMLQLMSMVEALTSS